MAIPDADKEGFLRAERSPDPDHRPRGAQPERPAILYADQITDSMRRALDETERRRANRSPSTPSTASCRAASPSIKDLIDGVSSEKSAKDDLKATEATAESRR